MHARRSHHFRKSFATALAVVAGLLAGAHVPTSHETTSRDTTQYFVMQAYASDAFVPFLTGPAPAASGRDDRPDAPRECAAWIDVG